VAESDSTVSFDVTVVIPCRNAGSVLGTQLRSLTRQERVPRMDVVVVDDGSTDDTVEIARSFDGVLAIRVLRNPGPPGAAHARNAGARAARSDLVLFLDSDDAVNTGYVRALTDALRAHGLVTALVDFDMLNPRVLLTACPRPHPERCDPMFGFLPHAGGGAIGIRRQLFEALDGFDPGLPWLHDADLCWRAQLVQGQTLFVATDAVLYLRLRNGLRALYRQAVANGRDGIELRRRYAAHGVPYTPWSRHLRQWWKTMRVLRRIGTRAGRNLFAWRLGKQVGRLRGLLAQGN
jgi:glycosyltransferase involved in cell wall biosynthesis